MPQGKDGACRGAYCNKCGSKRHAPKVLTENAEYNQNHSPEKLHPLRCSEGVFFAENQPCCIHFR